MTKYCITQCIKYNFFLKFAYIRNFRKNEAIHFPFVYLNLLVDILNGVFLHGAGLVLIIMHMNLGYRGKLTS